jgi:arabinosaccharide transport system substrate-binding protein
MEFPYGRAPLGILALTLLAGAGLFVLSRPASHGGARDKAPDLIFATFTKEHATAYREALPAFEKKHNCTVQIQVVDPRALQSRLQAAMQVGAEVPDMVELQDGFMSFFIKGPLENIQMADLTDRLKSSGLYDQIVFNRFSKWSRGGRIFALPHDVHPTMLAYRKDLIAELGIDVSKLTTWEDFSRVGREIAKIDGNRDGQSDHYMIDLPSDGEHIVSMLALQHGTPVFDADGNVMIDGEGYVDVICWYVKQIQGPTRVAFPAGWGQNLAKAMIDGLVLFIICPDWRTMQFEMDVPSLKGKLALMPLPAWKPGGLRTSTWGATGLAFPKGGKGDDELAWQLAVYLYFDVPQLGPRFLQTNILPPLTTSYDQPEFSAVDDFWGVSLGQTFIPLASQVPPAPTNAYHFVAVSKINKAFYKASAHYAEHGEVGLRDVTRRELQRAAEEVRQAMRRNIFMKQETGG